MSKSSLAHEDELEEIIYYMSGLKRAMNRKFDEHAYVIQQQSTRIEELVRANNEQRHEIDELGWQIRDLRDSVRRVNEKLETSCVCNYENHVSKNQRQNNAETQRNLHSASKFRQFSLENDDIDADRIYEPVEISTITLQRPPSLPENPPPIPATRHNAPKLPNNIDDVDSSPGTVTAKYADIVRTKMATTGTVESVENAEKRSTRYVRPIPPVAAKNPSDGKSPTFEPSLASLMKPINFAELQERDSIDEEALDVTYRSRDWDKYSKKDRGSSKVLCSLISDVEEIYMPEEEALTDDNIVQLSREANSDVHVDYFRRSPCSTNEMQARRMGTIKSHF